MRCKCRMENSTCAIVQKSHYSPNRTNRSNRQASTRVPEYRGIFLSVANEMQMSDGQLYLSDRPKILYSPNKTNRSNRQASTRILEYRGIFLSVANEMQMSDGKLYLSDRPKILYLPNRTNRSTKTSTFTDRI